MPNDSSINVTPRLAISVRTPQGEAIIQLSRLSAQILASTLQAHAGVRFKGVDANAGRFTTVVGEAVLPAAKSPPVVRLGPRKRAK